MTDYLTQQRDSFLNFAESSPAPNRPSPYELAVTGTAYRSGTPAAGTQSVVFRVGEDVGAHPVTSVKAFSYDLSERAPLTFDTLFKPGSKPLDVVYPAVRRELQKRWGAETLPPLRGGLDVDTYQNFAITDDAVIFFFGQNQLVKTRAHSRPRCLARNSHRCWPNAVTPPVFEAAETSRPSAHVGSQITCHLTIP